MAAAIFAVSSPLWQEIGPVLCNVALILSVIYRAVSKVSYSREAYSNILFFSGSFSMTKLSSCRPTSFFNRMISTGGSTGAGS